MHTKRVTLVEIVESVERSARLLIGPIAFALQAKRRLSVAHEIAMTRVATRRHERAVLAVLGDLLFAEERFERAARADVSLRELRYGATDGGLLDRRGGLGLFLWLGLLVADGARVDAVAVEFRIFADLSVDLLDLTVRELH